MNKVKLKFILNLAVAALLLIIVAQRIPNMIEMYQAEGQPARRGSVTSLAGNAVAIPLFKKHALVFWATWCGPCGIELGRINKLVTSGKISPDSVLAVSISESHDVVSKFISEKGYKFQVAIDDDGRVAQLYKVAGTPTILLIDEHNKIEWMTTGLSPSLELRLLSFLGQSSLNLEF